MRAAPMSWRDPVGGQERLSVGYGCVVIRGLVPETLWRDFGNCASQRLLEAVHALGNEHATLEELASGAALADAKWSAIACGHVEPTTGHTSSPVGVAPQPADTADTAIGC